MTIQSAIGFIMFSGSTQTSPATIGWLTIDAAGEKVGFLLQAPKTGNIRKVGWMTQTVTTGDTVDVRIETIASSVPSGTLWATNTNGSQVVANTDDNVMFLTTLTADASVTQGDFIAVVIANGAGGGNLNIRTSGNWTDFAAGWPKSMLYTTSWSTSNSGPPAVYFEYSDGSVVGTGMSTPVVTVSGNNTINSSSTPDEVGNLFSIPFPAKVVGVRVTVDPDDEAFDVVLYDSDGTTILSSLSADGDVVQGLTTTNAVVAYLYFTASSNISANTNYRIVYKPTTTTNHTWFNFTSTAAALDAYPMGNECYQTSRTDGGAWSDDTTKRVMIYPLFSGFDDGVGGGLKTHPGMGGGMRG